MQYLIIIPGNNVPGNNSFDEIFIMSLVFYGIHLNYAYILGSAHTWFPEIAVGLVMYRHAHLKNHVHW